MNGVKKLLTLLLATHAMALKKREGIVNKTTLSYQSYKEK